MIVFNITQKTSLAENMEKINNETINNFSTGKIDINKTRYTVEEFVSIFSLKKSSYLKSDANFYEISPINIYHDLGYQIFRDNNNCETWIASVNDEDVIAKLDMLSNTIYDTIIDTAVCNPYNNGNNKNRGFLYTITGNGIDVSEIGYLNQYDNISVDIKKKNINGLIPYKNIYFEKITDNYFKVFAKEKIADSSDIIDNIHTLTPALTPNLTDNQNELKNEKSIFIGEIRFEEFEKIYVPVFYYLDKNK